MDKEHIPELQKLVTKFEFEHIAMFPTVLRLLYYGPFMDELRELATKQPEKLKRISKVVCYRVIDNERIEMDAETLWVQLNYHLMHLLDFIPVASWDLYAADNFLNNFSMLHEILTKAGQLHCRVDYQVKDRAAQSGGENMNLLTFVSRKLPPKAILAVGRKAIKKFSDEINHSLDYEILF